MVGLQPENQINWKDMNTRIMTAAALLLLSASCSKWTEMQSIEIRKPSLENSPELYAAYCGAVREYKASEHKIMYVAFDNVEQFKDQSCNLTSLPDSVDYVEICNPESASLISGQMDKMRKDKAFSFTVSLSADRIEREYEDFVDGLGEEQTDVQPDRAAWFADAVKKTFGYVDEYGFDGVRVQYTGYSTHHLTEEQLAQYSEEQEAFFTLVLDEMNSRPGLKLFLNAKPEFLVSGEILDAADYVILPTEGSTGSGDLGFSAIKAAEVCPDAKLLYAVTTITDDFQTGWFSGGEQIPLASEWMTLPASYAKDGMAVYDVRRAFYDANRNVYSRIRKAIRNMNPNS